MERMDLTFESFTHTLKEIKLKEEVWNVNEHTHDHFEIQKKYAHLAFRYTRCDSLTKAVNQQQDIPCLVYRKEQIENQKMPFYDMFEAIQQYKGKWYTLTITVKLLGIDCIPRIEWAEMSKSWNPFPNKEEVNDERAFEQTLLDCIQELPEFRLYAVTGMLEGWDRRNKDSAW